VSTVRDDKKVTLPVFASDGSEVGEVEVSSALFAADVPKQVIHDAVEAYLANQRQGNADTKERGEVAGSTKKLYKQKGTGRARVGSRRSPTRVHGGTVFGPHPHSFRIRLPKKIRRQALCGALTTRATAGEIKVLDVLQLEAISTKVVAGVLNNLGLDETTLLIIDQPNEILTKSARNIERLEMVRAADLNTYQTLLYRKLLFTREGLNRIQEVLA
jgi:large subunit ribosomal protein L4